ncbi:phenylalanine--tRNA ligase subunit beta [Candidatus Woesearchaeota archaeon]|nr:phenylalanine--tRNA ligase subunit beta [Candidatus Woesearchaeota archaeon]
MPTIQCSFQDLKQLYGEKISPDELKDWLRAAKAEIERHEGDILTIALGDTNQPYLWSAEGIARFLRHYCGLEKGIPSLKKGKSKNTITVDPKLAGIRPYIAAFTATGKPLTDYLLRQLIQLQEKIAEGFGRKRQKLAIGIYPAHKITFPLTYHAADPEKTAFVPLDGTEKENLRRILAYHPKGKDYSWILKDAKEYPVLEDAKKNILSFPPVINSQETGRVEIGDKHLFFEATGTDHAAVQLAATIFAYALADRGFSITEVTVTYKNKAEETPVLKEEQLTISADQVSHLLGLHFKKQEIKQLLERAQYDVTGEKVTVAPYRGDVLHAVDVIEDIGIMYGYDKIEPMPLTTYTIGAMPQKARFINGIRELLVGAGYQEVLSPILTSNELLRDHMNLTENNAVEIDNVVSQAYSAVRTWILPILLDMLARNKHADYPQRVFEQGLVSVRNGNAITDEEHVAVLAVHHAAAYTEMRQLLEHLMSTMGITYTIESCEHASFIPGRVGCVIVLGKKIGYLGEVHPVVLEKLELEYPAVGMELNLSGLKD